MSSTQIEQIKKLFALANDKGASEHEAERALELATSLMIKHGITQAQVNAEHDPITYGSQQAVKHRWQTFIAEAAGVLYAVVPVNYCGAVIHQAFVGRQDSIEAAEMTVIFLADQVERLYKANLPRGLTQSARAEFRSTFKLSCALRVLLRAKELMKKLEEQGTSECTALVVQSHRKQELSRVEDFLKGGGVKTKNKTVTIKRTDGSLAGRLAGDQVKLRQEVRS